MDYRTVLGLTYGDIEVTASAEENTIMIEDNLEDTIIILDGHEVDQLIDALREAKYETHA